MAITRRQFIFTTGAVSASALGLYYLGCNTNLTESNLVPTPSEVILGGGQGMANGQQIYFLAALNLGYNPDQSFNSNSFLEDNGRLSNLSHYPLSFLAHGISFHPLKPSVVSIFEKKGPGACELDLKTGLVRSIATDPKRYFYGHGAYIFNQGLKLLSTETVLSTGQGLIVVRDAETLKIEGHFPSYGCNPHDCTLIENGSVLAVTNGGAPIGQNPKPSVVYIDVKSQKLLEKFEIEDPKINAGHLAISENKDLAVVSAPRLGLPETDNGSISILSQNNKDKIKKLITLKEPKEIIDQLKSETLSVCIDDERGILAATSPAGNLVTFWNIKLGSYISSISITKPRGIIQSKNKKYFLISFDTDASLAVIDANTLKLNSEYVALRAGFSGSHLYSI